jgi:hypothetical protein
MNAEAVPGTVFLSSDVDLACDGDNTARNRRKRAKTNRRLANARARDAAAKVEEQHGSAETPTQMAEGRMAPLSFPLRLRASSPRESDNQAGEDVTDSSGPNDA